MSPKRGLKVPARWRRFILASNRAAAKAESEFERAWPTAHVDLYRPSLHEVVTGLMAHQVYLFKIVATDVNLWYPTLGGMALRAMTESLMNMRWIGDDADRAEAFQHYSLGRRKLLSLHIERLIDEGALKDDWQQHADELRTIVDSGKWGELLDIELGTWNGQSVRETAVATDMKFEYDLLYAPASAAVHVEWSHLQETALERCREVLHRAHWIPRQVGDRAPHPVYASQGAHLLEKSSEVWAIALGAERPTLTDELRELDEAGEALAKDFFGWPAAPTPPPDPRADSIHGDS